ncbi:MAG: deoxyribodipyrimidine photo-lyase [Wenzhouxiangellaceae bacterium]
MKATAIVWFRQDLRLRDNPALDYARNHYDHVIPLYIWDEKGEQPWAPGGASRWWLHHSLQALDDSLQRRDSRLLIRSGDSEDVLRDLIDQTKASAVLWNRRYEPHIIGRDKQLKQSLKDNDIEVKSFNGSLWWEPWELETTAGDPYKVFTPLWKRMLKEWRLPEILPRPRSLSLPRGCPKGDKLDSLALLPERDWADAFAEFWEPGEDAAKRHLETFLQERASDYQDERDIPAEDGTSRLSAHLHFGEVSPGQVVAAAATETGEPPSNKGTLGFVREIAWREFSTHLLYHFPHTTDEPMNDKFAGFPWRKDYQQHLKAWQRGRTGVPIVDAGMRQLWHCGWMHNRVRMLVASYLTKNLLIPWQEGAQWFWDTLVDADLGNNTQGWQWTAGCGADAAPYFRIFNPVTQGERFDPQGEYVRQWVPELQKLPAKYIHQPWSAPAEILNKLDLKLGRDYPKPMVDLKATRERALEKYQSLKS